MKKGRPLKSNEIDVPIELISEIVAHYYFTSAGDCLRHTQYQFGEARNVAIYLSYTLNEDVSYEYLGKYFNINSKSINALRSAVTKIEERTDTYMRTIINQLLTKILNHKNS